MPSSQGFKLLKYFHPRFYNVLDVDASIPMDAQELCPACDIKLKTLADFFGQEGKQRMRYGVCADCGYAGYIDRPSQEWVKNYYLDTWDEAKTRNIPEEVENYRKAGQRKFKAMSILERLSVDKNRYALEIGCGYGRTLRALQDFGFKKVVGLDNSKHRAMVASRAFGFPTVASPFEHPDAQNELKKYAPYSLIISRHVLEHTYHPAEIVKKAGALQGEGDYLVLLLPNAIGETSGSLLFYWPHLHGFTPLAVKNLLAKNGYEIVDDSMTSDIVNYVVARKTFGIRLKASGEENQYQKMLLKFTKNLGLDKEYGSDTRLLWWFRKYDFGGQVAAWSKALLWPQWLYMARYSHERKFKDVLVSFSGAEKYQKHCHHVGGIAGAAVESLKGRFTFPDGEPPEGSPIEIQFAGNIKLLQK